MGNYLANYGYTAICWFLFGFGLALAIMGKKIQGLRKAWQQLNEDTHKAAYKLGEDHGRWVERLERAQRQIKEDK